MKTIAILVAVSSLGGGAYFVGREAMKSSKLEPTANIYTEKNYDDAIEHCRVLWAALRDNGWEPRNVDPSLLRLADQDFAEDPSRRGPDAQSFAIPTYRSDPNSVYQNVAFFTTLYVRKNASNGSGPELGRRFNPTGYYIVCFKDGRVEKVSVLDVRFVSNPTGPQGGTMPVFPGMAAYRLDLPKYPGIE